MSWIRVFLLAGVMAVASLYADENPPQGCGRPFYDSEKTGKERGYFMNKTSWKTGGIIPVYFMNGSAWQRAQVEHYAREWELYGNFRFEFHQEAKTTSEEAILIKFEPQPAGVAGSSSIGSGTTGTNARSMSLADVEYFNDGLILHEFGHALGLHHEQDNPQGKSKWIRAKAYIFFKNNYNMNQAEVDKNIFNHSGKSQFHNSTKFDNASVMGYYVAGENFMDGVPLGISHGLSEGDKHVMATMYPGRTFPVDQLATFLYDSAEPIRIITGAQNAEVTILVDNQIVKQLDKGRDEIIMPWPTNAKVKVEIRIEPKAQKFNGFLVVNKPKFLTQFQCSEKSPCSLYTGTKSHAFYLAHVKDRNTGQYLIAPPGDPNKMLLSGAAAGDLAKVEKALGMGADVNFREHDFSALMYAAQGNHVAVAKFLLERGATDDKKAAMSASRIAGHFGYIELIQLLGPADEPGENIKVRRRK